MVLHGVGVLPLNRDTPLIHVPHVRTHTTSLRVRVRECGDVRATPPSTPVGWYPAAVGVCIPEV